MKSRHAIAGLIDHTLLRPDAAEAEIVQLCEEAATYGFHSVCIHPFYLRTAGKILSRTDIRISTVTGFPLGMTLPQAKIYEAIESAMRGADELDIVMNIGQAKSGNWEAVGSEISDIIRATPGTVHKIIIEACYLTDSEKKKASSVAVDAGAEFIKTSTGFGPSGAAIRDIRIIRSATGRNTGIKAAGGIRTLKDVMAFIDAGATRIGTSSGVEIMKETP